MLSNPRLERTALPDACELLWEQVFNTLSNADRTSSVLSSAASSFNLLPVECRLSTSPCGVVVKHTSSHSKGQVQHVSLLEVIIRYCATSLESLTYRHERVVLPEGCSVLLDLHLKDVDDLIGIDVERYNLATQISVKIYLLLYMYMLL